MEILHQGYVCFNKYCQARLQLFWMSLVQSDMKRKVTGMASDIKPLIAQTLWTACYKVKTGTASLAQNFIYSSHMLEPTP